jgi:hypothetical protein
VRTAGPTSQNGRSLLSRTGSHLRRLLRSSEEPLDHAVADVLALPVLVGLEPRAPLAQALFHDRGQFVDPLGVGTQQGRVLAPADLVDEGGVGRPDRGAAPP